MLCVLRVRGRTDTPGMCTGDEFRSAFLALYPESQDQPELLKLKA